MWSSINNLANITCRVKQPVSCRDFDQQKFGIEHLTGRHELLFAVLNWNAGKPTVLRIRFGSSGVSHFFLKQSIKSKASAMETNGIRMRSVWLDFRPVEAQTLRNSGLRGARRR